MYFLPFRFPTLTAFSTFSTLPHTVCTMPITHYYDHNHISTNATSTTFLHLPLLTPLTLFHLFHIARIKITYTITFPPFKLLPVFTNFHHLPLSNGYYRYHLSPITTVTTYLPLLWSKLTTLYRVYYLA